LTVRSSLGDARCATVEQIERGLDRVPYRAWSTLRWHTLLERVIDILASSVCDME